MLTHLLKWLYPNKAPGTSVNGFDSKKGLSRFMVFNQGPLKNEYYIYFKLFIAIFHPYKISLSYWSNGTCLPFYVYESINVKGFASKTIMGLFHKPPGRLAILLYMSFCG